MGKRNANVQNLLRESGFIKLRVGKHEVWKSPGGSQVVVSVSPSGTRSAKNEMSHIKRIIKKENL